MREALWSVVIFAFLGAQHANSQEYRYWYSQSCQQRIDASIISVAFDPKTDRPKHVVVEKPDGNLIHLDVSKLFEADALYADAFHSAISASTYLTLTPFASRNRELKDLREELSDSGVSKARSSLFTWLPVVTPGRDLAGLAGKWVEINGVQYRVASVRASKDVT